MSSKKKYGFTLIELLIVVAIIGILAAIAIPNFLSAQIKAKVARANSELRSLSLALDQYGMDQGAYPTGNAWQLATRSVTNKGLLRLTTPISYVTAVFEDAFQTRTFSQADNPNSKNPETSIENRYYKYHALNSVSLVCEPPVPAKKSEWFMVQSSGPDNNMYVIGGDLNPAQQSTFGNLLYDPTNGAKSTGSLFRASGEAKAGQYVYALIQKAIK